MISVKIKVNLFEKCRFWGLLILMGLGLTGCYQGMLTPPPIPTQIIPPTTTPSPTLPPDEGRWRSIAPGIQQQTVTPFGDLAVQMIAVRLDPAQVTFRVHYQPGAPLTLAQWEALLPDALVIVNANFFDREFQALGLLVTDGLRYGLSYTNRGGTFAIENGQPRIWSNITDPYQGQPLEQAVQAFPMLVQDGVAAFNDAGQTQRSRRTVIGMDADGYVILMATPFLGPGLYDLSQYLPQAELNLQMAFNLDGGGSTMLSIVPGQTRIASFDAVPAVLAIYPR